LPLVICTVYHGNFADPRYQRIVVAGITAYNDVIIRTATRFSLPGVNYLDVWASTILTGAVGV